MANAMVALATTTLASAASSVTFGSIPATYRDLRLVFDGSISSASSMQGIVNGDTGANYASVDMRGATFGAASFAGTSRGYYDFAYNNFDANTRIMSVMDVLDYSATDKHKSALSRNNGTLTDGMVIALANRWANTAAITSLKIQTSAGNFNIGSTFSLYGIAS